MGWSGGTFTRVHDWTTDEGSAIDIEASRMDAEDDNFASGINACLTKDGSNSPTANLPMDGNRHTGVDDAAALTDYASAADVIDQHLVYYVSTYSTNDYSITPDPAITAYAAGQKFAFKATSTNTGAPTLNVNSLGAKDIVYADGSNDLQAYALQSGGIYEVIYESSGDHFQLVSPAPVNLAATTHAASDVTRGSFHLEVVSLADDATGVITLPNARDAGFVRISISTGSNSTASITGYFDVFFNGNSAPVEFNVGTDWAVGAGSNPDTDAKANFWRSSAGSVSIKNRLGGTRYFHVYILGGT